MTDAKTLHASLPAPARDVLDVGDVEALVRAAVEADRKAVRSRCFHARSWCSADHYDEACAQVDSASRIAANAPSLNAQTPAATPPAGYSHHASSRGPRQAYVAQPPTTGGTDANHPGRSDQQAREERGMQEGTQAAREAASPSSVEARPGVESAPSVPRVQLSDEPTECPHEGGACDNKPRCQWCPKNRSDEPTDAEAMNAMAVLDAECTRRGNGSHADANATDILAGLKAVLRVDRAMVANRRPAPVALTAEDRERLGAMAREHAGRDPEGNQRHATEDTAVYLFGLGAEAMAAAVYLQWGGRSDMPSILAEARAALRLPAPVVAAKSTYLEPAIIGAITEIRDEYARAAAQHAKQNSAHEGYAVLLEEVDELWDVVKTNPKKLPGGEVEWRSMLRKEAIQVGAMAVRFVTDVCGGKS